MKQNNLLNIIPKILLSLLLLLTFSSLSHAKKRKSDIYMYTSEWKVNGNTRKLFKTPFGTVYKLHEYVIPSMGKSKVNYMLYYLFSESKNKPIVNPLAIDFCKKSSDFRKLKRYIAVDFKIRLFPAISKDSTNFLNLKFFFSSNNANNIRTYNQLNSVHFFNHSGFYFSNNYSDYSLKDLIWKSMNAIYLITLY